MTLRLRGVGKLPRPLAFRLMPGDDMTASPDRRTAVGLTDTWRGRDLRPLAVGIYDGDAEIVVGPDVTRAPALSPGTLLALEIPDIDYRREFRWPRLTPAHELAINPTGVGATAGSVDSVTTTEQRAAIARFAAAARERMDRTQFGDEKAQATPPKPMRDIATPTPSEQAGDAIVRREVASPANQLGQRLSRSQQSARCSARPPATERPRDVIAATFDTTQFPNSERARLQVEAREDAIRRHGRTWTGSFAIFLFGCIVTSAACVGLIKAAKINHPLVPSVVRAAINATPPPSPVTVERLTAVSDVPKRSPSGQNATAVGFDEALRRAETQLRRSDQSDGRVEAKFWLRHALTRYLDQPAAARAFTDLGALYANPGRGAPDFASAEALWTLAAARGNTRALCYLASMYQNGRGV
ncbi:MAG: hypothetical protein AAFY64_09315, partial [Pseudomonadota bacterium]